jgi:hypothetical protein
MPGDENQRPSMAPLLFVVLLFLMIYLLPIPFLNERVRAALLLISIPLGIGLSVWCDHVRVTGRYSISLQTAFYIFGALSVLLGAFIALTGRIAQTAPGWAIIVVLSIAPLLIIVHSFFRMYRENPRGAWTLFKAVVGFVAIAAAVNLLVPVALRYFGIPIR